MTTHGGYFPSLVDEAGKKLISLYGCILASSAFVVISHIFNRSIAREYEKIARAVEDLGEAWFIFQGERDQFQGIQPVKNLFIVSRQNMLDLGFPMIGPEIYPGSTHFPLFNFLISKHDFDHYWLIEYDVRFSGDWRYFFQECTSLQEDFLSPHLYYWQEEPAWYLWDSLTHPEKTIPLERRLRCFHPVMRISRQALQALMKTHQEGWRGHGELLIPTLLHEQGFTMADFGGTGSFVPPGWENKFYASASPDPGGKLEKGTFRFRPSFIRAGREKNKLYHPVKSLNVVGKEIVKGYMIKIFGKQRTRKLISVVRHLLVILVSNKR